MYKSDPVVSYQQFSETTKQLALVHIQSIAKTSKTVVSYFH